MQLGIPFSFVGHANDLYERRVLLSAKLRRATFVSCISRWHRDLYQSLVKREASAYPIIRCGVDTEHWPMRQKRSDAGRGRRLLTLCRLIEKKGIDTLIRSLARLRSDDRRWRLTIAGTGPEEGRLRSLARELGCDDAIEWLGPVDSVQVRRLMSDADFFVLPCREDPRGDRDGIPVVLMEAMASGVPVVAGDLDSIRDLVHNGENGLLVRGDDPAAVASAVQRLHRDPETLARMATEGREHVIGEFSRATNIDRLEAALFEAIGVETSASECKVPPVAMHQSRAGAVV